jgi:RsiW-degrading membrane proteinase PrsW (M82 family)
MEFVLSSFPVLVFLAALFLLDSFRLLRKKWLVFSLAGGIFIALAAYFVNTFLASSLEFSQPSFSRYVAPLTEESLKSLPILFLLYRRAAGFLIDAATYGFAVGTGFALTENLFYVSAIGDESSFLIWVLRGFGAAVMHGGTGFLFAGILMAGIQKGKKVLYFFPAFIVAVILHSLFNHFLIQVLLQTVLILLLIPFLMMLMMRLTQKAVHQWLEIGFSDEIEMLRMIRQGKFGESRSGRYLYSLRDYFSPEVLLDLYCYIEIWLELSVKAKRNLMLREMGIEGLREEGIEEKLLEWQHLRQRIGKMGEIAVRPLLYQQQRDLWKMQLLKQGASPIASMS